MNCINLGMFSKTAEWIRELGNIGDELHPSVGAAIRTGADSVSFASRHAYCKII